MSIPLYQLASTTPGEYQFTMPSGFNSNVEVHLWGAGGGSGLGVAGGGGGVDLDAFGPAVEAPKAADSEW